MTLRAGHCQRAVRTSRAWGDLWHLDGDKRLVRNAIPRARDIRDYSFTDWLYGPTALTRPGTGNVPGDTTGLRAAGASQDVGWRRKQRSAPRRSRKGRPQAPWRQSFAPSSTPFPARRGGRADPRDARHDHGHTGPPSAALICRRPAARDGSTATALGICEQVAHLCHGKGRNHQPRPVSRKELNSPGVIGVSLVEGGDKRARVAQDHADVTPPCSSRSG